MSISALGSSPTTALSQTQNQGVNRATRHKAFDAAAQALGMSSSDLRTALRSGQTLASLAQSKGVRTDTLTSAISSALTSANSSLSSDQAQRIAQRMIAGRAGHGGAGGVGGPGAAGGPGGPGGAAGGPSAGDPDGDGDNDHGTVDTAMDSVASTLGLGSDQLRSQLRSGQLRSGQSLTAVASAAGMDATTLKTTLAAALTKADSSLSADQASSLADKIITGPPGPQDDTSSRLRFALSTPSSSSGGTASVSASALSALYSSSSAQTGQVAAWA